jgi:TIR domain-containing protein
MAEPNKTADGKLKVFISYSRDDLDFADQLVAGLEVGGFEPTIDRHGISGGEDWKRRLGGLLRDADTVVFVLSPSSARSEICAWEVEEAVQLGKRILPVNCRPLAGTPPPSRLEELNYIFFYAEPKSPASALGWRSSSPRSTPTLGGSASTRASCNARRNGIRASGCRFACCRATISRRRKPGRPGGPSTPLHRPSFISISSKPASRRR